MQTREKKKREEAEEEEEEEEDKCRLLKICVTVYSSDLGGFPRGMFHKDKCLFNACL
jgi:hypothetical protein